MPQGESVSIRYTTQLVSTMCANAKGTTLFHFETGVSSAVLSDHLLIPP